METPPGHCKAESLASLELTLGKLFMEFPVNEETESEPESVTEGRSEHKSSITAVADAETKDGSQTLPGRPEKFDPQEIETDPRSESWTDLRESQAREFGSHANDEDRDGAAEIFGGERRGQPSDASKKPLENEAASTCAHFRAWDDPSEWIHSLEDVVMRNAILEFLQGGRLDCEEWMWKFMRSPPLLSKPPEQRDSRQKVVLTDINRRDPASRARKYHRRRESESMTMGTPPVSRSPFAKMQAAVSPCFVSNPTNAGAAPWIEKRTHPPDVSFHGQSTSPDRTPDRSERRDSGSQEEVESNCDWAKMLRTPIRVQLRQNAKKRFRVEDDGFSHKVSWPSPKRKRWSSGRCSPTNSAQLWSEESRASLKHGLTRTRSCGLRT